MTEDEAIEWRRSPLDKETLRRLTARSDLQGFRQVFLQFGLLASTGAAACYALLHWPVPLAIAMLYIHATFYSFLGGTAAVHELSHRTVFRTRFWNELFIRLASFLSWQSFVWFRASHVKHHQYTVYAGLDMEVVQPIKIRRRDWLYVFTINPAGIRFTIAAIWRQCRGKLQGEWDHRIFPESDPKGRRHLVRWARITLLGHAALAAAFIGFGLWPLLLVVTCAPFFAGWLNFLCTYTQHTGLASSVPDFRLICRTVKMNPLLSFVYWQMNYHVEHHSYAAVPFYNLPKLRRAIEADLPPACRGLVGAWREILATVARQKKDPQYVFVPKLPESKAT